jgi:hypothetical protein
MPHKDKSKAYQKIIIDLLQEYDTHWGSIEGMKNKIVADTKTNTFVFMTYGWQNRETYTHLLCFHLEIIEDKVWIHENNTDAMIAIDLIQKGVNPEDIVIGFEKQAMLPATQTLLLS